MAFEAPDFRALLVPNQKPTDWPFGDWMSPEDWQNENTASAWHCFFISDILLGLRLEDEKFRVRRVVMGFDSSATAAARVVKKEDTLYLGIDSRLFRRCLAIATSTPDRYEAAFLMCRESDGGVFDIFYDIYINLVSTTQQELIDSISATAAMIGYIVGHELAHLEAGHFELLKDHVRRRALVRALEFSADHGAIISSFMSLMSPMIVNNTPLDKLETISKRFGMLLATILMTKVQPPSSTQSLYPSFYERLLLLMGQTFVVCGKGDNPAHDGLNLVKRGMMKGIHSALAMAAEKNLVELPENIAALSVSDLKPQQMNCLSCSTWARHVYGEAVQIEQEVLNQKDIFARYQRDNLGFRETDYNLADLYSRRLSACRLDRPMFFYRLELIATDVGQWLRRVFLRQPDRGDKGP